MYWILIPHTEVAQIGIENVQFNVFFAVYTAIQTPHLCHIWLNRSDLGHFYLPCEHSQSLLSLSQHKKQQPRQIESDGNVRVQACVRAELL